jgi:hypothetical protein
MFSKIPEKDMHLIRWSLAIGWWVLIMSMFYDPISAQLTVPNNLFAASTAEGCFQFQGECRPLSPYPMGARIFWGMVLPLSILTLLILGHEAWRRICPLSFMSQIPRALGWQRKRIVNENSWLARNALSLQFGLLFIGLNLRLLLVNSDRLLLGIFLIATIFTAITVGFLYDGKTWCNYFCPMGPVQMIYSEPGGLLSSKAHTAPTKTITQSMCRTRDKNGKEKSACVACNSPCIDIDAERSYWDEINQPDRKLLYYGYVGLVIGFYLYFWLYSGHLSFISSGVWNETNQLATLLEPGFYTSGKALPIPKLLAVPLTLAGCLGATYAIGLWAEKAYKRYNKRFKHPLSIEQVHNRAFAIATFLAFNLLFFLGVRPTLSYLPSLIQQLLSWAAVLASSLWLVKTWGRSPEQYARERDGNFLRRQLSKLDINFSKFLDGRSLDQLNPDELYALAKVLPGFTEQYRLQVYTGVLREALEQRSVNASSSLNVFKTLRQELSINDSEHWTVLTKLHTEEPQLFAPHQRQTLDDTLTVRRPANKVTRQEDVTVVRPANKVTRQEDVTVVRPANKVTRQEDATVVRPANKVTRQEDATVVRPANKVTPREDATVQRRQRTETDSEEI